MSRAGVRLAPQPGPAESKMAAESRMATVNSEKLIELVKKSQLVEAETLDKAVSEILAENGGSLPSDPAELAKALQKRKVVTRWHCDKLLLGKYKGFFLGKHKLLGHIGSGGMSSVYLAEHTKMHDLRAIKVLPQSKLGKSSYLARFQQEAKAIASLNHPEHRAAPMTSITMATRTIS